MQDVLQRLDRLQNFLNVDPSNAALLVDIAQLQLQLGEYDAAIMSARRALDIDDNIGTAHAILGIVAAQQSNFSVALPALNQARELGTQSPLIDFFLANTLAHIGRYEEALTPAKAAAAHPEACPHAAALVLRILHYLGEIDEAISFAKSIDREISTLPKAQGVLASILLDADCIEEASAAAHAALAIDAEDMDAATTVAFVSLINTEPQLANDQFSDILGRHPHLGRAQLGLGLSNMLAGNLSEAIGSLESATQSLDGHLGTLQALAWCHILQKNTSAAEATLNTALTKDRNFAETHGALAITALMQGNLSAAQEHAKRAIALDRQGFTGLFAQSVIERLHGNSARGQQIVEELLTKPVLPGGKTIFNALTEMAVKDNVGSNKQTIH